MSDPHKVTRDFESAIAEYTGAPFCVAVNSCTMALLLASAWWRRHFHNRGVEPTLEVPKRTYVGVPMSVINAGCRVDFVDREWIGAYQLYPSPIWDSARWLTAGLWRELDARTKCTSLRAVVTVSFHATKTLGIEQGGAILCHGADDAEWFKRARFDGRTEGVTPADDEIPEVGYHCYMNPSTAAQGLMRLRGLPKYNAPLTNDAYPDLSLKRAFRHA
jgi:dTDP-4-amino-4,6-dideoxygalactose transaminase